MSCFLVGNGSHQKQPQKKRGGARQDRIGTRCAGAKIEKSSSTAVHGTPCPVSLLGMGRIKSNHKKEEEERGRTALEPDVLERGFKRAALQQFMELHRKAVSGDGGQVGCRQLQPSGKTTKRCKSSELPGLIPAAKLDLSFQEKFL